MNKTILITGAGTGIGRDAAFALVARGHRVLATTFDEPQAVALRAECKARKQTLEVFKLDITSQADREKALDFEIDVLINNAAIGDSGSLAEVDVNRIRQTFEVNVFAMLELTQVVLRGMIARQRGTVLFVSSIAGRIPVPFLMPYSMSKFALSAAGAALRVEMDELGCNIHAALIEPGAIHTGFNQSMNDRKYEWMGETSYFKGQTASMRVKEARIFRWLEARSTGSIVKQLVKAAEARRPRLRYVAPWAQGAMVRLARIFGARFFYRNTHDYSPFFTHRFAGAAPGRRVPLCLQGTAQPGGGPARGSQPHGHRYTENLARGTARWLVWRGVAHAGRPTHGAVHGGGCGQAIVCL